MAKEVCPTTHAWVLPAPPTDSRDPLTTMKTMMIMMMAIKRAANRTPMIPPAMAPVLLPGQRRGRGAKVTVYLYSGLLVFTYLNSRLQL